MTDASDIYHAAKLVIDRHGEDAPLYVAARDCGLAGEATSRRFSGVPLHLVAIGALSKGSRPLSGA
jgi:hypothetical protein